MAGGFVLDRMVTKWSRTFSYTIFWGPLVDGILDLLIKSKLLSVHRRTQQSTAGTILRLKAKTVPTGHK